MNSKERVKGAFSSKGFDRLPMWYGADVGLTENLCTYTNAKDSEDLLEKLGADFYTVRAKYTGPELKTYEDGTYDTMWGIRRGGVSYGMALEAPLQHAETVKDIEKYEFPKAEWFDCRFTEHEKEMAKNYFVIGGEWAPFWHETYDLITQEKMLMDLLLNPAVPEAIMDRCLEFHLELNERIFTENPGLIDMYWFANDIGTNRGLIMNPDTWRKYIKPREAKLAEQGHKYGMTVCYHSCGDITSVIPDLIEIGIEVLNPIQVSCKGMDPEYLKKEFGKDIVLFGGIDYNQLLSYGTEEEVRENVRFMIDTLGYDGRYIVAPAHDLLMDEVPAANMFALYDEAKKYSPKYAVL